MCRFCAECGEEFEARRSWQEYCSIPCRRRANKRKVKPKLYLCEQCGGVFGRLDRKHVYCSSACHAAAKRERYSIEKPEPVPMSRIYFPNCAVCGLTFAARFANSEICSDECRKRKHRERWSAAHQHCKQCGERRPLYATFCESCAALRARQRATTYKRRKRAKVKGVPADRINPLEIYERDGWRCGICMRKVSPRFKWPDPRSVSLDHIVPLSLGGGHVRANVQCSHLGCNMSKSNRGHGQLLLVG